jgi:hypothetical protein
MIDNSEKNKVWLALFQEQWTQIRHLDGLDYRTMSVLPIAVSVLAASLGIMARTNEAIPEAVLLLVCLAIVGLSFSGCYTTCRNWLCYMRRLSILSKIEDKLELLGDGVIGRSLQFKAPTSFCGFHRFFFKSIRFPLTVFYCLLAGTGPILFEMQVTICSLCSGATLAIAVFTYCDLLTYISLRKEFAQISPPPHSVVNVSDCSVPEFVAASF